MRQDQKDHIHEIIFGTDTPAGKRFDVWLIVFILLSVGVLLLESLEGISRNWRAWLYIFEWIFTLLFTLEYILRIYVSAKPWGYIRSFYGTVDLLSVIPSYLGLLVVGANYLLVIRLVRVLRVFRVLKLLRYWSEANLLLRTLGLARRKIMVFFMAVLVLATIFGAVMFIVEGPENGFSSIPKSIYWTIVTITTVGYGDITPHTVLGQIVASIAMLTGYSIIAVPTGIITAELSQEIARQKKDTQCRVCAKVGHDLDASFCKNCGESLQK